MKGSILFCSILLLISSASAVQDCKAGYDWQRMSGVGCVQTDCNDIPYAHYSSTKACVCGSSGSIDENPKDANIECHRPLDDEDCPGCVYACVRAGENCPDETEPRIALPGFHSSDDEDSAEPIPESEDDNYAELVRLSNEYLVKSEPKAWPQELTFEDDELDENACSPAEHVVYEQHVNTKEIFTYCSCKPGFKRTEKGGCIFDTPDIPLNEMDMRHLETTLLELDAGQSVTYESRYEWDNKVKIGIVRLSDYELAYSLDGKTWSKDLKTLMNPSLWQQTKKGWNKAWGVLNPVNWFGHTAYKDADKELKWQIADATLKRYRQDMSKPKHYMYDVEYWYKYGMDKNDAARQLRDMGLVDGSFDVTKGAVWNDFKGHLYAFPAESVKKLQAELTTDDFAQAFSIYANYRKDKTPEQIIQSPPEDLELAISIGTASSLGEVMLYRKYEEAYQRYLVAQQLSTTNQKAVEPGSHD